MDMNHEAHRIHEEIASRQDWTEQEANALYEKHFEAAMNMSLATLNDHDDDLEEVLRRMSPEARVEFKRAWAGLVAEGLTDQEMDES